MFLLKPEEAVHVHLSGEIYPCCPEMFHQAGAQIQCSPLTSAQSPMEKRNVQARRLGPSDPWADTVDLLREMFELMRIAREVKLFYAFSKTNKKKTRNKNKSSNVSKSWKNFIPQNWLQYESQLNDALSIITVLFICDNAIYLLGILNPQTHKLTIHSTYTLGHETPLQRNAVQRNQSINQKPHRVPKGQTEKNSMLPNKYAQDLCTIVSQHMEINSWRLTRWKSQIQKTVLEGHILPLSKMDLKDTRNSS